MPANTSYYRQQLQRLEKREAKGERRERGTTTIVTSFRMRPVVSLSKPVGFLALNNHRN